ncbi:MAG: DarT ssDNA thymidine ADP-ribosyltransferase family protein [Suipraeoptans sp.]
MISVNDNVNVNGRTRSEEIRRLLLARNVKRLCHLTQINNLISILYGEEGVWATDFIDEDNLFRNDTERLDGKTDYISTSIEYPNVWYYRNKKYANPEVSEWAILFIDPIVCELETSLFCPVNAATSHGAYIGREYQQLYKMFSSDLGNRKRTVNMLSCCPTDDQAEVLIYKNIPTKYISGIAFEREHTMKAFKDLFEKYNVAYPDLYVSNELFGTAMSSKVRMGLRPDEKLMIKGGEKWHQDLCS